jgi:hypothetical protein
MVANLKVSRACNTAAAAAAAAAAATTQVG